MMSNSEGLSVSTSINDVTMYLLNKPILFTTGDIMLLMSPLEEVNVEPRKVFECH